MKRNRIIALQISMALVVILIFTHHLASAQDVELVVVGHSQSAPEEMTMVQLQQVLKGEKLRWDDGTRVKVALFKTSTPAGSATCQRIFKMTSNELNKYFLAQVFQGKVKAPTFFNSKEELERYVSETPGAIGVSVGEASDQVQLIMIEGKSKI